MLLVLGLLVACGTPFGGTSVGTIAITSSSFADGQPIPKRYTCDGENISPPLAWHELPDATKSIPIIVDDTLSRRNPLAAKITVIHWVLYDLPAQNNALPENVAKDITFPNGAKQGPNDLESTGYSGPCLPPGSAHRYVFTVYALDAATGLQAGATKAELLQAMEGHILGQGQLAGTYQRGGK